ncbi:iron-containing alcohol dehydrogenase [Defluviitalea raffinosedens]|uniref:Iron-containing alcohol dehydrogenase n=1 Tax=Defluviitalea raffinosedens TaxID=1450156 RepID=A0A7C8LI97_9FIRM|nr:phosphonoacetaldehyde reductase [Defluviitalea raffinosedens]KAE9634978.1 iron-containing alcohol dehydrogenase [Defluviitalea raffinosedens]
MSVYFNPVKVYFGEGQIDCLSKVLDSLDEKPSKILLLTGKKSLKSSGKLDSILKDLSSKEVVIYNDITSNPDITDLLSAKIKTDFFQYDSILAIGGGSVIDMAKALSAIKNMSFKNVEELRRAIADQEYLRHTMVPLIAVPTTSGTGSEVTSWATIWDQEEKLKYSIESRFLYPKAAIIDPQLTIKLPLKITVSTALDALCHATESYWAKKSNEITRMYALEAIRHITQNLEKLIEDLEDITLRKKLAYASLYAGLAFSNTKTTACHAISYPLTLIYDIEHGIAASMTLGPMLKLNQNYLVESQKLIEAFGVKEIEDVDLFIKSIYEKVGLPRSLEGYGVSKKDIEIIVSNSYTPGRMDNNPRDITKEMLRELLFSIY